MADRTVRTTLIANVTGYVEGIEKAAKKTRELGSESEKLAQKKEAFNQLGQAGLAVGALAAAGVALAVAKYAEFDKTMSQVQAATGETAEGMADLRQAALDAGRDTAFSALESAEAITELGKAGLSTKDILAGGLTGALDLAAAGQLSVARAAEVSAISLSQFGLDGSEASRVADALAAGANKALGSVDDLANGLKFVGPVAAAMGISLEETTGTLALFAQQGIIGEQAGTSLRGVLSSLTSPSSLAAKEIERLGITLYDSEGGFLGLENAAGQLSNAYLTMDEEARNASLGVIFGRETITAATALYQAGAEGVAEWTDNVTESGYAAEQAATLLDNLAGDVQILSGSLETAFIGAGSGANDILRFLTQSATEAVNAFTNLDPAAQTAAIGLGSAVAAVGLGAGAFFTIVPKVAEFNAALEVMGPKAQKAGRLAGGLAKGLGAIAAAAAVVTVLDKIASSSEPAALGLEEVTRALLEKDFNAAFAGISSDVDGLDSALAKLFSDDPAAAFDRWGQELFAFTGLSSDVAESKAAFDSVGQSLAQLVTQGNGDRAAELFASLAEQAEKQGISTDELLVLLPAYRDALAGVSNEQVIAEETAAGTSAALDTMTDASGQTEESLSKLADALRGFNDQQFAADDALFAFKSSILDIDALMGEDGFTGTLDLNTEEGIKNSQALRDIAAAANTAAGEALLLTGSQEDANAILEEGRAELGRVGEAFGLSGDALQEFIDRYVSSPQELAYQASVTGIENMKAQLQSFYDSWKNREVTVKFFADTYNLDRSAAAAAARLTAAALATEGRADGGAIGLASGGAISGPGGPRDDKAGLFRLSNGEHVLDSEDVRRMGGQRAVYDFRDQLYRSGPAYAAASSGGSVNVTVSSKGGIDLLKYVDVQVEQGVRSADSAGRMVIENGKKAY